MRFEERANFRIEFVPRHVTQVDAVHLNAISINGTVLLTGEAPTAEMSAEIGELARAVPGVITVHNEMAIGPQTTMAARTTDTVITGKVKSALLKRSFSEGSRVKVVTEARVVYLMGVVTREEAAAATEIARYVDGVERVVKIFEYRG